VLIDTDSRATQAVIGQLVGVSQQAISALVNDGKIPATGTVGAVLLAYCERLREQAAGRMGEEGGGLDLVQERAALARSQRIAQDLKNDIARGEYAPIGLLTDVLATASAAVVDRFEQLEGALRKACPDLPDAARSTVMTVIASARNEWIRSTAQLVDRSLDEQLAEQADDEAGDAFTMDDLD
jgi:phage terminase Nu1 subunit (DNA packaging protein)